MFDLARSAEAMFSRWAIKRFCKFLLKKRLGDLILGDIDLDQLDVQLSSGTIQLSDLALNVDFLNQKLVGAPVTVKEGSMASLSVKIPWKLQNCQIVVEELELVLSPFLNEDIPMDADTCKQRHDDEEHKREHYLNVHEGVKTIAKMVKWFLTSFHIRLKNLIVAFDPSLAIKGKVSSFQKSLVLRITEIEYGTCVSEDATTAPNSKVEGFLGMAKLTNFVKFEGAVVEFLEMDDVDNHPSIHCDLGTSFSQWHAESTPLGSTSRILTGASGGFSGNINLSIPWKNGSLDLRKVDAEICLEPVQLRIQPSTIEWMIAVWESFKNAGKPGRDQSHYKPTSDSLFSNSRFYDQPFMPSAAILGSDAVIPVSALFSNNIYTETHQGTCPEYFSPRTQLIHNWVPFYISEERHTQLEPDYGASLDQFFECFDELRSSQASSGNSGIWNWTCSVFSAISVASNLASGSTHIPIEQHVETSVRANISEVAVVLYFHDEHKLSHDLMDSNHHIKDQGIVHGSLSPANVIHSLSDDQSSDLYMSCLSSMITEQSTVHGVNSFNLDAHNLQMKCQNVALNVQTCPQKVTFEASVSHVKIDEYFDSSNVAEGFDFNKSEDKPFDQMILNEHLQGLVQGALPPFPFSAQGHNSERCFKKKSNEIIDHNNISRYGLARVALLESFGICRFIFAVSSTDIDGRPITSTSFSVHLPPLVLWVHFHILNTLLNLFKQVENYFEKAGIPKDFTSDVPRKCSSSSSDAVKSGTPPYVTTLPSRANLQVNLVLHHARIIVCFSSDYDGDLRHSISLDEFVVIDHFPSLSVAKVPDYSSIPSSISPKGNSCTPSTCLNLNVGNFGIYLVGSAKKDALANKLVPLDRQSFSAVKILSHTSRSNGHSGITMLWQKGPVTGPWMANRAWSLAASHDRSRCKVAQNDYEFCTVRAAEDPEQTSSHIRQELIMSSAFSLHVRLSLVQFNLSQSDYKLLNHLLFQAMSVLSNGSHDINLATDESVEYDQPSSRRPDASQTCIFVEFEVLDLCVVPEVVVEVSSSIQKELPGSWNCFRLKLENLELLSVSDIGGISSAQFLWLNHGEGELLGSIFDSNGKPPAVTQDILLITCKDSCTRRGAGDGANALSFGSAGTTVTHMWNPSLLQGYTSIIVRCGTIVAPGGRLDWISAICLFFSLPEENEQSGDDGVQSKSPGATANHKSSFFLDLVDVALSYEPHIVYPGDNLQDQDTGKNVDGSNGEIDKHCVSCLLAAASLSLSNHTMTNSTTTDYRINLQNLGLLICESSSSRNASKGCHHANHLQKTGYVKVAQEALIEAVLRINGLLWEIQCSDAHINLDTCHDTTHALIRVVAQLQQLYAPDMEDAITHLQCRWNNIHQANNEYHKNDVADASSDKYAASGSENEGDFRSVGVLDEILEDAFYMSGANTQAIPQDSYNSNIHKTPPGGSIFVSGTGRIQRSSSDETCSPQIIESYYASKLLSSSKSTAGKLTDPKNTEFGKGGWYTGDSIMIVENHISNICNQPEGEQLPEVYSFSSGSSPAKNSRQKGMILLKNTAVRWRMYAGCDWSKDTKLKKVSTHGSNSSGRDGNVCLELTLSGLNLQYDLYPDGEISLSKLCVSVQDIHLYDKSRDAPWKTVLGYYSSKGHRRESCAKAFKLDLETVRPDPSTPLEDYRLYLEFLPMRLHLDQDQLNFLISFFSNDSFSEESASLPSNLGRPEVLERKMTIGSEAIAEEALLPFFQKCDVRPVVVRIDYIPRHMDLNALRRGSYVELLNLVPWKGIDLQLKHVCAGGVYGWSSVCETVIGEWLEDISHNQVHKLLKGFTPLRSLFAVSSGTSKLVSLPVKSYKKDHKLLKGIQRGGLAFIKSISLEAVGLGMHLAAGAHEILIQAESILTSIPPSVPSSEKNSTRTTVRSNQPEDAQQGIQQAYESLSDGFGRSASALLGAPLKAYQRGAGPGTALATAVRAVPAAAIAPVSASARAVHCALLGVRNSLDPERKKESMEKYFGPSWS